MKFDIEKFERIAAKVYPGGPYSFEECMMVFRYFFERYEQFAGQAHPPIKAEQIAAICRIMPFADRPGTIPDYDPSIYTELIDRYFRTPFRSCNYRINHFFSGQIRDTRYLEFLRE